MAEMLISLFIDDEMDLDEKITFVETVQADDEFADEALTLLRQEKRLMALPRTMPAHRLSAVPPLPRLALRTLLPAWPRPWTAAAAMVLAACLAFFLLPISRPVPPPVEHRFVIYLPQAREARVVGTFTDWQPVPMEKMGDSGYWTLTLKLPQGEHRYIYLLDGGQRLADPTIASREEDDFGGENSLLTIGNEGIPLS